MALAIDSVTEQASQACENRACEKAISLLEEALRQRPIDFTLHYRLGQCYGGLCRRHSLVHSEMALAFLRQALRLARDRPGARAEVLDQLAATLLESGSPAREGVLLEAIGYHEEAAGLYRSLGMEEDWGRAEYNLGNSYCELAELTGQELWREAIAHYLAVLEVRTREQDPEAYAAVLTNLGTAYRHVPAIGLCIQYYHRALVIYGTSHPEKTAALENNLGNAFLSLVPTDRATAARNIRRALRHFDRALKLQQPGNSRSRVFEVARQNRARACERLERFESKL